MFDAAARAHTLKAIAVIPRPLSKRSGALAHVQWYGNVIVPRAPPSVRPWSRSRRVLKRFRVYVCSCLTAHS
jgi:hypothetical protein